MALERDGTSAGESRPLPATHLLLLAIGVPGLATAAGYALAGW